MVLKTQVNPYFVAIVDPYPGHKLKSDEEKN
jgi:hypothetical protein